MFEKVNPSHPDKIADRIAGALVDLVYCKKNNLNYITEKLQSTLQHPKAAFEVMIGHGKCVIMGESEIDITQKEAKNIVGKIADGTVEVVLNIVKQDERLARNQEGEIRCGDNGMFKGCPTNEEEKYLTKMAHLLYHNFPTDGKYLLSSPNHITVCQSFAKEKDIRDILNWWTPTYTRDIFPDYPYNTTQCFHINPLGEWAGSWDVDTGCCNRKLGSDMGRAVTGSGIIGKDLSKADVTLNIIAYLEAQRKNRDINISCNIGNIIIVVDGVFIRYSTLVEEAWNYIIELGGFEKFAEWGLIR